jgi:hypothetical protein
MGFEPTIFVFEPWTVVHALVCVATVIGNVWLPLKIHCLSVEN